MVRAAANQSDTLIQVDFTNTSDRRGGKQAHVPPGDYLLAVQDARVVPVKSDPTGTKKQVKWVFRIVAGEAGIGEVIYYYTSLDQTKEGGLWDLRNILSDLADGADIPKQKANVDLASKVGKRLGATLVDDEPWDRENQDGSITTIEKSTISGTFPASRYVGPMAPSQAATVPAAPAAPQNGAATDPVAVAAAIAQPDPEDADIAPLAVADL